MIQIRDAIPVSWTDFIRPKLPVGIGVDPATTTKATSNPTGIAVMQRQSPLVVAGLVVRVKIDDEGIMRTLLEMLVRDIIDHSPARPRKLCIDASNEEFFAQSVRKQLAGKVSVELIKGSQNLSHRGQEINAKKLTGSLLASAFEDNIIAIPPPDWLKSDLRLVKRDRGSFISDLSTDGGHGDCFDGMKLAYWALESGGGPVQAHAAGSSPLIGASDRPSRGGLHPVGARATLAT